MEWQLLSKNEAKIITDQWMTKYDDFKRNLSGWPQRLENSFSGDYQSLRKDIYADFCNAQKEAMKITDVKSKSYIQDLCFAIALHKTLSRYGFSLRIASNDMVWMYLCVNVFPDIIYKRYGEDGKGIPVDHYWRKSRRIYLKSLWWYIYLSWQNGTDEADSYKKTFEILKNNSTDEILNLVERAGREGYRVDVYRHIMAEYANSELRGKVKQLLRKVMVLNTARTAVVEPNLAKGGVQGYVKELYSYFEEDK